MVETRQVARGLGGHRAVGGFLLGVYGVALISATAAWGIPFEREQVLAWAVVACVLASVVRDGTPQGVVRAVRDWSLLAVLFLLYDYSRGAAETLGMPLQVQTPITIDEALFGGKLPTVELQRRLGPFDGRRWWEAVISVAYVSHFIVPYVATAYWWIRDRGRWRAWIVQFGAVTSVGLLLYVLLPTVPPWYASGKQAIAPIRRTAALGWRRLGLESAERLIDKGQATVNLFAAFPSLHAAYPALLTAVVWARVGWFGRLLGVAYTLIMAFALVISGEHYVIDVLGSWAVVGVVVATWKRLARTERVATWLAS